MGSGVTIEALAACPAVPGEDAGWLPADALGYGEAVEELRRVRRLIARLEARSAELIDLVA